MPSLIVTSNLRNMIENNDPAFRDAVLMTIDNMAKDLLKYGHPDRGTVMMMLCDQGTVDDLGRAEKSLGRKAPCKRGCTACCHQYVAMSKAEGMTILAYLRHYKMPSPDRAKLRQMVAMGADPEKYWQAQIPCPFLKDGLCSIYPVRPLVCRSYYVAETDNSQCAIIEPNHIVKVLGLSKSEIVISAIANVEDRPDFRSMAQVLLDEI